MSKDESLEFRGAWWQYPPLRNALIAGALAGVSFVLSHRGLIDERAAPALYLLSIPIGAYHWAKEAVEGILREHEVGIGANGLRARA